MSDVRLIQTTEGDQGTPAAGLSLAGYSAFGNSEIMQGGVVALTQSLISNLLTDPGSAATTPNRGGGLLSILRKYRTFDADLAGLVTDRIRAVQTAMKEEQKRLNLPRSERLDRIEIVRVVQGDQPNEIIIDLRVYAQSGDMQRVQL